MKTRAQRIRDFMAALEAVIKDEPRLAFTDGEIAEKVAAITGHPVKANRIFYYRKALGIPPYNRRRKDGEEKTA